MFTAWVGRSRGWGQEGQPVAFLQVSLTAVWPTVGAGRQSGRAGAEGGPGGKQMDTNLLCFHCVGTTMTLAAAGGRESVGCRVIQVYS